MAGLAIFFVLKIIHAATVFANAEGPEQRKEARWKLIWVVAGLICAIIGPALILILMNTVGKTIETQTSGDGSAAQASLSSFRQNISLNIPILDF